MTFFAAATLVSVYSSVAIVLLRRMIVSALGEMLWRRWAGRIGSTCHLRTICYLLSASCYGPPERGNSSVE